MVVLSALVRISGLPSAAPLLVQHGLRSTTWRTREGALKLLIAGLLYWRPSSPLSPPGVGIVAASHSKKTERLGDGRGRQKRAWAGGGGRRGSGIGGGGGDDDNSGHDASQVGDNRSERGRGGRGDRGGRGLSSGGRLPMPPKKGSGIRSGGHAGSNAMALDNEKLLRDVGSLLMDERPEVGVDPHPLALSRTDAFMFSKNRDTRIQHQFPTANTFWPRRIFFVQLLSEPTTKPSFYSNVGVKLVSL